MIGAQPVVFLNLCPYAPEDGYSTLASLCSKAGFYGYQVRPKIHMLAHIVLLGKVLSLVG